MRRLPKDEETIPIIEVEGRFLTLGELERLYPEMYQRLLDPAKVFEFRVSYELLTERVRRRHAQGRVPTIYRWEYMLTPEEQIRHMELRDEIGLELLEAERKLLEEELAIIRGG